MKQILTILSCTLFLTSCEGAGTTADPDVTPTPTISPTNTPTPSPSSTPTPEPSNNPTPDPSNAPTPDPSSTPTPNPTFDPALESYISQLSYTSTITRTTRQLSMNLNTNLVITQFRTQFYSDRSCQNLMATTNINGRVTLLTGSYTSTNNSNLLLCSSYNSAGNIGCVYEFSNTRSIKISVRNSNNTYITSNCLNNPANNGERIGEYLTDIVSRNCSINNSCTFSESYAFYIN